MQHADGRSKRVPNSWKIKNIELEQRYIVQAFSATVEWWE
jgi:hypothetical protein